jgi:hypothetical protein
MSSAEELARLAAEAEAKAADTDDPVAKRLWTSVADEWHEAEKSARAAECGSAPPDFWTGDN